jgi:hypothetical protein
MSSPLYRPPAGLSYTGATLLRRCRCPAFSQKRKENEKKKKTPGLIRFEPLTHAHRSIGYRNRNPQLLAESAARLMYLRAYDSRDSSRQSVPSPSLCYLLTHDTILTITQVLWFLECLTWSTVSCCVITRTRLTVCLPVQPSVYEAF